MTRRLQTISPILAFLLFWAMAATAGELRGRVTYVYDGDTVKVSGVGKVRLLGIDTPEHEASGRDYFYRRFGISPATLRAISRDARITVGDLARGREVRLETEDAGDSRDRHGRLLAYLYLPDGRLLNRELLERGLATVYRRFDFRLKSEFLAAEDHARRQGIGLWKKEAD